MTIKHLVISGGGHSLFTLLGTIREFESQKFLQISELQSIYGTSAGAILGVILTMGYDWETIYDYLIKRPWHDAFKVDVQTILNAYSSCGLFDKNAFAILFKPLFEAKDVPMDITLAQFYHLYPVDLHFFTFEMNHFIVEDISHTTHPDIPLLKAIQMTCALPMVVAPVHMEGKCYIDGGIVCNYPLNFCIEKYKNTEDILSFKNFYSQEEDENHDMNETSTMLDFLMHFSYKLMFHISTEDKQIKIKNEVLVKKRVLTLSYMQSVLNSMSMRKELYEEGIVCTTDFLKKLEQETATT